MAVEQTQVLPAPVLEAALTAFTQKLAPLMGTQLIRQHMIHKLQHKHITNRSSTAAAGLGALTGTGPQAYQLLTCLLTNNR